MGTALYKYRVIPFQEENKDSGIEHLRFDEYYGEENRYVQNLFEKYENFVFDKSFTKHDLDSLFIMWGEDPEQLNSIEDEYDEFDNLTWIFGFPARFYKIPDEKVPMKTNIVKCLCVKHLRYFRNGSKLKKDLFTDFVCKGNLDTLPPEVFVLNNQRLQDIKSYISIDWKPWKLKKNEFIYIY